MISLDFGSVKLKRLKVPHRTAARGIHSSDPNQSTTQSPIKRPIHDDPSPPRTNRGDRRRHPHAFESVTAPSSPRSAPLVAALRVRRVPRSAMATATATATASTVSAKVGCAVECGLCVGVACAVVVRLCVAWSRFQA